MELEERHVPHTQKYAIGTVALAAGKTLKVETSPAGEEILTAVVPAGKVWSITIVIDITETDV